jgi:hypothetical protein
MREASRSLQLLNHTAGWEGDLNVDTGEGDDALASFVACMAELEQVTRPGAAVSYNNASLTGGRGGSCAAKRAFGTASFIRARRRVPLVTG